MDIAKLDFDDNAGDSLTGGYIFKVDFIEPNESKNLKSWDEIKKEKNYKELVKGKASIKRILQPSLSFD